MLAKIIILIALTAVAQVASVCKVCNSHGIACISETQFHVCKDSGDGGYFTPDQSVAFHCPANEICTDLAVVCVSAEASNVILGCISECDKCWAGNAFACTSRTTFALCQGMEITNVTGTCSEGMVCDNAGTTICVKESEGMGIKCDRPAVTTTTTTTPPPPIQTADEVCASQNAPGRFPNPNDTSCLSYVYCRYSRGNLVGFFKTCRWGTYFNKDTKFCCNTKPSECD